MILTKEQISLLVEAEVEESFHFDWKNNKYRWVDDKKELQARGQEEKNIATSMTARDENNQIRYSFQEKLLPNSGVVSYNLYDIKNFYPSQALKHGKVSRTLTSIPDIERYGRKKDYDMTPDESIEDFKQYTADYIIRILRYKRQYDLDVILSPQSSSNFNSTMIDLIAEKYQQKFNKKLETYPNAFVKTPDKITVKNTDIEKNFRPEVEQRLGANATEEHINKAIQEKIATLHDYVQVWKKETQVEPTINIILELRDILDEFKANIMRMGHVKREKLMKMELNIDHLTRMVKDFLGDDYTKTRFFRYSILRDRNDIKPWQIKLLSDGMRQSINNIFQLSDELNKEFTYQTKSGETKTGRTALLNRLIKGNKTIMIFDDNISSGTTMDSICEYLINNGVNKDNIVVITLGVVKQSTYYKWEKMASAK